MAKVSRGFSPKDRIVDASAQSGAERGRASHARAEVPSRRGKRSGPARTRHSVEYDGRATLRSCTVDDLRAPAGKQGDVSSLGPACLLGRAVLQQIPSTRRPLRELRRATRVRAPQQHRPCMINSFLPLSARPAGRFAGLLRAGRFPCRVAKRPRRTREHRHRSCPSTRMAPEGRVAGRCFGRRLGWPARRARAERTAPPSAGHLVPGAAARGGATHDDKDRGGGWPAGDDHVGGRVRACGAGGGSGEGQRGRRGDPLHRRHLPYFLGAAAVRAAHGRTAAQPRRPDRPDMRRVFCGARHAGAGPAPRARVVGPRCRWPASGPCCRSPRPRRNSR